MYEQSKDNLDEAQLQAKQATRTIGETNRTALRNYLRAAFSLQRAGLEAIEALQRGAEELTFTMLDRAEDAQSRAGREAEERIRENVERLREARARVQDRLRAEADDAEESGERVENRLRESAEIGVKVLKVMETRIETMLTEMVDLGRRELNEIEDRIDALVQRLDHELEEEIHPIANYDDKNVDEVADALGRLDEMQLRTVRAYEVNNKNRVTILRAIDEKLAQRDELIVARDESLVEQAEEAIEEAMETLRAPIANYDELNAQEVDAKLEKLDISELGTVRAYEMANKNRVTVLRAIDEHMEARAREAMPA